ncbi:MAG: hypothetical protein ACK521_07565 [bacterium]
MPASYIFRKENSRLLLVESDQPNRSVFNIGTTRHNQFMPDGVKYNPIFSGIKLSDKPTRMIEWIENAGSSFSKSKTREITSKIGK